jgi:hypothetical protein
LRTAGQTLKPVAILLVLTACAGPTGRLEALNDHYQKSIAAAAVKEPDYARPLQPIDASRSEVRVANIGETIGSKGFTWVTFPGPLRELCRGKPDPLLALQQALGLPPEQRQKVWVFTFDVRPADIFRPCASSPDITTTQCTMDLPKRPPVTSPKEAAEQAALEQAVAEHFVLKQMMDSYRNGFKKPGYPFTAMGWTYNWDPESPTHIGVSEYVVKPKAVISNVISVDPATFCQAQSPTVAHSGG